MEYRLVIVISDFMLDVNNGSLGMGEIWLDWGCYGRFDIGSGSLGFVF